MKANNLQPDSDSALRPPARDSSQRMLNGRVLGGYGTRLGGVSRARAMMWRLIGSGSHPGEPHGLLTVWPQWENLAHHMWPVTEIPGAPYGTLEMRIVPYHGAPVSLPDGTHIERRDLIGELHCNNSVVLELVRQGKTNPYRAARADLEALARWVAHSDAATEVRAFYGFTMLATAAERLGFSARECEAGITRGLNHVFMTGLLLIYTRDGLARLNRGRTLNSYPKEVWMSRGQLLGRYGKPRANGKIAPVQSPGA